MLGGRVPTAHLGLPCLVETAELFSDVEIS